jgi:hypothetical protein
MVRVQSVIANPDALKEILECESLRAQTGQVDIEVDSWLLLASYRMSFGPLG